MRVQTRHCDRCGQNIIEGGSIVQAKAGELVGKLPEEWDVCSDCGTSLLSWYRSGRAGLGGPGVGGKSEGGRLPLAV